MYLRNQCNDVTGKNAFWGVVKPLISDKVKRPQDKVLICDDGNILNDQKSVNNAFNEYFNSIVAECGSR